jgi:flagellar assembly protein FliH
MPLFKPILKPDDAHSKILTYSPRTFNLSVPEQAVSFARNPDDRLPVQPFVISGLTAETTKLHELEKRVFQTKIEMEVLTRLKSVEETAYAAAHGLGMAEGQEKGFNDIKADIQSHLNEIEKICKEITHIKSQLLIDNEKHFVTVIFNVAKAIALKEIQAEPENILNVVKLALENAQTEEEITLRLNPQDATFLESVKTTVANPFERLTRLRVETDETLTQGGVVVETNYGVVDATIETRLNKVWEALASKIPQKSEDGGKA